MDCFVYFHLRNDLPFYVGIGGEGRATSRKQRSDFHLSVWDKALEEGTFQCRIVYRGCRKECERFEKTFIKLFGKRIDGGLLCNFTDGGDGGDTWVGPGVEERRSKCTEKMKELWQTPEYREKHHRGMTTSEKVKENCRSMFDDPVVREKHRKAVQKKGKYSQQRLNEKYGSDKKGSRWYYNTEEGRTKMFQFDPGHPWVLGRRPPIE